VALETGFREDKDATEIHLAAEVDALGNAGSSG
jgi:hypothetical protein